MPEAENGYASAVEEAYAIWRERMDAINADYTRKYNALMAERQRAIAKARDDREFEIGAALRAAWMADHGYDTYGYE